jgi:hypothetical protein
MNTLTGDKVEIYVPNHELRNNALCFSQDEGFTFSRVVDGKNMLLRVPLQ